MSHIPLYWVAAPNQRPPPLDKTPSYGPCCRPTVAPDTCSLPNRLTLSQSSISGDDEGGDLLFIISPLPRTASSLLQNLCQIPERQQQDDCAGGV